MHRILTTLMLSIATLPLLAIASDDEATRFSQCLTDKGAIMYSAWWCPYCYQQLKLIDPSLSRADMKDTLRMKAFPFMKDCSGKDPGTLKAGCVPGNARGVPFWTFKNGIPDEADGESYTGGAFRLEGIAQYSGCPVPARNMPSR